MTNRREFLQGSAVMSVLAMHGLAPSRAAAVVRTESARPEGHVASYDDRYAECRTFATMAAAFGATVRPVERGDVTALYDELDVAWRAAPTSIAGMTQFGPMLVIERLARERGMRLLLRAEHQPDADGGINHLIAAPSAALALAVELWAAGPTEWPVAMAALVSRALAAPAPLSSISLQSRTLPPSLPCELTAAEAPFIHYYTPQRLQQGYELALDGPLYSWLMAPAQGAHDARTT